MNQWNAQRKEKLSDELSDALKNIKKGEMEKLKKQKSNAWKTSVAFAVLAALAISVGCWWYFTQEPKIVEKLKVETVYQDQPVFWNTLSPEQKDNYLAKGMAYFPEVFSTKYSTKYQNFNAWILEQGVTVPNTNDLFSAGGRDYINVSGKEYRVPRVFVHLDEHFDEVISAIKNANDQDLKAFWGMTDGSFEQRIDIWKGLVAENATSFLGDTGLPIEEMLDERLQKYAP